MKKDQIKSRSKYEIKGYTLESMLSQAYGFGRMDERNHPHNSNSFSFKKGDDYDEQRKEAIYQSSRKSYWDVFEIIKK